MDGWGPWGGELNVSERVVCCMYLYLNDLISLMVVEYLDPWNKNLRSEKNKVVG